MVIVSLSTKMCRPLLFGGDQLTAARARGAKKSRRNSEGMVGKLTGLHPVAEDWHTKANFLEVCTFSIIIRKCSSTSYVGFGPKCG